MKRARHKQGSVVLNKRNKTWHYLWCEGEHRRSKLIGTLRDYPTKAAAWRVAENIRRNIAANAETKPVITVASLIAYYRIEKMPERASTRRGYETYIGNHILPRWGDLPITAVSSTSGRTVAAKPDDGT